MEFVQGQVFNINKLTERIKKSKHRKEQQLANYQIYQDFQDAVSERAHLQNRIEHNSDKDLLAADIYRLKATEILQNYHIKTAKQQLNSSLEGQL